jgi:hypothetical protein
MRSGSKSASCSSLNRPRTVHFDEAGRLEPAGLSTLDAGHLVSPLALGNELESIITYDDRLADAETRLGTPVIAPR